MTIHSLCISKTHTPCHKIGDETWWSLSTWDSSGYACRLLTNRSKHYFRPKFWFEVIQKCYKIGLGSNLVDKHHRILSCWWDTPTSRAPDATFDSKRQNQYKVLVPCPRVDYLNALRTVNVVPTAYKLTVVKIESIKILSLYLLFLIN